MSDVVAAVIAGDRRAAGRLLSAVERGDEHAVDHLKVLYRAGGHARVIGVTGPPGAGKSTIVDGLLARYRAAGQRVAVLAVDPSSPFSHGAVLGDRVRMNRHAEDDGVLIRSMAARGVLGGLAVAAADAITVFDAMGFDVIIVETVGVGQSEIDILSHADWVVLVQTALGGDDVQMVKAGILEIADIIVVNKADTPGSDKTVRHLKTAIAYVVRGDAWTVPVVETQATAGKGIDSLVEALAAFAAHGEQTPGALVARNRQRARARIFRLCTNVLHTRVNGPDGVALDAQVDLMLARSIDPYTVAEMLIK